MYREAVSTFLKVALGSFVVFHLFNLKEIGQFENTYKLVLTAITTGGIWVCSAFSGEILGKRYTWIAHPVHRFVINFVATALAALLLWWWVVAFWEAPWKGIDWTRAFRIFGWKSFFTTLTTTLFVSIFMHGRSFLMEWRQAASEAERLKKEQIAARYETLKSQVNPHFLFNSLNVLTELVHKDADQAELFVRQLSKVYRYVLESRDSETVRLEEELKQLEAYVFLLKIRFGDSFDTQIEVHSLHQKVAPLTLQMLVENAVKHNEASKSNPLRLQIKEENGCILVCNNLQLKSMVSDSSGVGLSNIRARYGFLTTQPVETIQTDTSFCVKVPLIA